MTIYSLDVLLFLFGTSTVVPCPVLTVASWPAYRFLRRQEAWSGIPISFRIFQFIVIHTVKGFAATGAVAKLLWSCPTLCNPIDQSTRLCRPWDSPGKNTEVGCHFLLQCMKVKVKSLSPARLVATPWTAAYQAPPSMGFSRQEHWSGLPLPSPQRLWHSQ